MALTFILAVCQEPPFMIPTGPLAPSWQGGGPCTECRSTGAGGSLQDPGWALAPCSPLLKLCFSSSLGSRSLWGHREAPCGPPAGTPGVSQEPSLQASKPSLGLRPPLRRPLPSLSPPHLASPALCSHSPWNNSSNTIRLVSSLRPRCSFMPPCLRSRCFFGPECLPLLLLPQLPGKHLSISPRPSPQEGIHAPPPQATSALCKCFPHSALIIPCFTCLHVHLPF